MLFTNGMVGLRHDVKLMAKTVHLVVIDVQRFQKVFTPLDFFHILLLQPKCIKLTFVTGLHTTIPHNVKVQLTYSKHLQINKK